MRIGIITGTGLYSLATDNDGSAQQSVRVETPYGAQEVALHETPPSTLFHVNRHGDQHRVPPHRLDPRRTIDALARCGVDVVFAVQNSGSLRPTIRPGDLMVPHDLVDLANHPYSTFFDDDVIHIDFSQPFCPHAREALLTADSRQTEEEGSLHPRGVYIATRGPRFETPAEVAYLSQIGDIIGMTGSPEAALARERGLCYAMLAFVANPAAGVAGPQATAREIRQALAQRAESVRAMVHEAASRMPTKRACPCAEAPRLGRLAPVPAPTSPSPEQER